MTHQGTGGFPPSGRRMARTLSVVYSPAFRLNANSDSDRNHRMISRRIALLFYGDEFVIHLISNYFPLRYLDIWSDYIPAIVVDGLIKGWNCIRDEYRDPPSHHRKYILHRDRAIRILIMNKFYNFQWAQKKGEILVEALKEYDEQALTRGNWVPQEPFAVKVSEGKKLYDIVHFQDPFNFAISERVHKLLKDDSVTGWNSYEIVIEGRSEKYYGFQVLGRCGELKRPKEPGFVKGCEFEYTTWDGSDFFCPDGTLYVFCTEKVRQLFIANQITNFELADISTMQWYSV